MNTVTKKAKDIVEEVIEKTFTSEEPLEGVHSTESTKIYIGS